MTWQSNASLPDLSAYTSDWSILGPNSMFQVTRRKTHTGGFEQIQAFTETMLCYIDTAMLKSAPSSLATPRNPLRYFLNTGRRDCFLEKAKVFPLYGEAATYSAQKMPRLRDGYQLTVEQAIRLRHAWVQEHLSKELESG